MKTKYKKVALLFTFVVGSMLSVSAGVVWSDGPNRVTSDHSNIFYYDGTATCSLDYVNSQNFRYWSVTVNYHMGGQYHDSATAYGAWGGPRTSSIRYFDSLFPNAPKTSVYASAVKNHKDTMPYRIELK